MSVEFEAEARLELRDAARWYEGQRGGLGFAFVEEVRRAVGAISAHPARWPKLTKLSRRYRLNRFPYSIVYQERESCLRVIAVMHQSRRPNYWIRRTGRK
jgi:plasmid stabilization system protein ParE